MRRQLPDIGVTPIVFGFLAVTVLMISSCEKKGPTLVGSTQGTQGTINPDTIKKSLDNYSTSVSIDDVPQIIAGGIVAEDGDDEDLNVVLPQCGIPDFADSNAKTFSTQMSETYTRVINAGFAVANVDISSQLDLHGTLKETTLDVHVTYANSSGSYLLGPIEDIEPINQRAMKLANQYQGAVTNYTVANNSNFNKDWKGIVCTIRASERLVSTRSGYLTEVKFSKPVAPAVSPIADAVRYEKELGKFRYFKDIEATVIKTNDPILQVGKKYTGSIFIEKVPSERVTPKGLFKGDVAYRVTNRFGTKEETLALGFHLWTEYYIDHGQRAFSAVITDVGDEDLRYFAGVYKGKDGTPNQSVSYEKDVRPLIANHCSECHRRNNYPRKDLTSYEFVKAQANEKGLIGLVLSGQMPPSGALSNEDKKIFSAWSQAGFPEK